MRARHEFAHEQGGWDERRHAEGSVEQLRGKIKRRWGKLRRRTRVVNLHGNLDVLAGKIQERHGERREAVEKALDELAKSGRARQVGE
jgi:uncharacterized protein YjbJ (UPF0337 family)